MDKLVILQIIRGLDIGGDSGGAEKFGVELARSLNRYGFEVKVCAFFKVGSSTELIWQNMLIKEGIDTFFLCDWGGYNNIRQYAIGLRCLFTYLKNANIDVVHSHFQLGSLTAAILRILRRTKVALRTAHIRHEWQFGKNSWILNNIFIKLLFPIILDAEVGVSQAITDYLNSHIGTKISRHIPRKIYNAVSYEKKFDVKQAPYRIPKNPDEFNILSVGRLTEQKGYKYLITAIPNIIKSIPRVKFYIVGEGDLLDEINSHIKSLGITNYVELMGIRSDVPYIMPQFDLFVLPSLWEGFPTVIMESMVSGVPVIATDIPGTRELIKNNENGWLVKPKDPEDLSRAIIYAANNKELRAKLAMKASNDVKNYFIDKIRDHYIELYELLLKKNN